jgi:hypothetical protein
MSMIRQISAEIMTNALALALFIIIVLLCAFVIYGVSMRVIGIVQQWSVQRRGIEGRGVTTPNGQPGGTSTTAANPDDDVIYTTADKVAADGVVEAQVPLLKRRMQSIQDKYAKYNTALAQHASRLGKPIDDLVTPSTLMSKQDTFRYDS